MAMPGLLARLTPPVRLGCVGLWLCLAYCASEVDFSMTYQGAGSIAETGFISCRLLRRDVLGCQFPHVSGVCVTSHFNFLCNRQGLLQTHTSVTPGPHTTTADFYIPRYSLCRSLCMLYAHVLLPWEHGSAWQTLNKPVRLEID